MNRLTTAAVIAFGFLAVALVLGIVVFGADDSAAPYITTVLGMLGVTIAQMMGNKETAETKETVTELNKDLRNGTFERLVREALEKIASDPDTRLEITQERRDEDGRGSNL